MLMASPQRMSGVLVASLEKSQQEATQSIMATRSAVGSSLRTWRYAAMDKSEELQGFLVGALKKFQSAILIRMGKLRSFAEASWKKLRPQVILSFKSLSDDFAVFVTRSQLVMVQSGVASRGLLVCALRILLDIVVLSGHGMRNIAMRSIRWLQPLVIQSLVRMQSYLMSVLRRLQPVVFQRLRQVQDLLAGSLRWLLSALIQQLSETRTYLATSLRKLQRLVVDKIKKLFVRKPGKNTT